jgi:AcrR family transcriptional regulator
MARQIEDARNARSRRTRAALLSATRELLEEQGFEALTMAAVAERAGISRRAVYLHFASRAELVTELFGYLGKTEEIADSLQRVWGSPDAVAALDEWARHLARIHPRILAVHRAADRVRRDDPDVAAFWDRAMGNWRAGCAKLVDWLEREGRLAPGWAPAEAADLLWALMSFDVLEGLLTQRGWTPERYAERMARLLRATFVAAP